MVADCACARKPRLSRDLYASGSNGEDVGVDAGDELAQSIARRSGLGLWRIVLPLRWFRVMAIGRSSLRSRSVIVLLAADGETNREIAARVDASRTTVIPVARPLPVSRPCGLGGSAGTEASCSPRPRCGHQGARGVELSHYQVSELQYT